MYIGKKLKNIKKWLISLLDGFVAYKKRGLCPSEKGLVTSVWNLS